jgi:predicted Zn finger-like uncharacterized protein
MKVVCESCQAKYQVPDERVVGKKLKIRCKRCGESVLIRGDLLGASDENATVIGPQMVGGVEWFASVEGDVSGPFSVADLGGFLGENPAGWGAYVWREGVSEWVPAHECAEIVAALGGGRTVVAPQGRDEDQPTRMFDAAADDRTQAREVMPVAQPRVSAPPPRPSASPRSSVAPAVARAPIAQAAAAPSYAPQARMPSPSAPPQMRAPSSIRPRAESLPPTASGASMLARAASIPPTSMYAPSTPAPAPSTPRAPSMPPATARKPSLPPAVPRSASMPPGAARAQSMPPARGDESVMLSTENLRQVAASHSQPPSSSPSLRPGMASGDGSGVVDIRALSDLAQQQQQAQRRSMPPAVPLQPSGNYVRVDSITPAAGQARGGAALPIAIFGGFALVAAGVFAAIVVTRSPQPAPVVAAPVPAVPAVVAIAQPVSAPPTVVQAPPPTAAPAPAPAPEAAPTTAAAEAEAPAPVAPAPEAAEPEDAADEVATGKRAKRPRAARGAESKKEDASEEIETPKEKAKEKAPPPSLDDVMLAEKSEPAEESAPAEPEPEPAEASGDIDDLLADKPAKAPAKDRSFDDLLDGAVTKKSSPAAAVPADEGLPESPTRDEVLSAMRGVESDVRGCDATGELAGSTVSVQIQVSGSTGKVTSAKADGAAGPAAACIAKAVRGAEFSRFSKPMFVVKFPFRFQ